MASASRLLVTALSGRVTVHATATETVSIVGGQLHERDGNYEVAVSSKAVEITVPSGTDLVIGAGSGRVECDGEFGAVSVTSASGGVRVDHAREIDVRCASGKVVVDRCDGECRATIISGALTVHRSGSIVASTVSGRIDIGSVDVANVKAVSGKITIASQGAPDIHARTVSGEVNVTVERGSTPTTRLKTLVGKVTCDCDPGDRGIIDVCSKVGSIRITQRK